MDDNVQASILIVDDDRASIVAMQEILASLGARQCGRTDLPHPGWKSQLLKWPREALYALNPDWAARWLGGYSLLVLAE